MALLGAASRSGGDQAAVASFAPSRQIAGFEPIAEYGLFADAALDFLCGKGPKNWGSFRNSVIGNFCVINPRDFPVLT